MLGSSSLLYSVPRWFEHLSRIESPTLRLFCFPYAGGSADVYRSWQRWFGQQCDICLVHLPGRSKSIRERPFTRIKPLVQTLAEFIESESGGVPYALYGHSMGALICFELARKLFRNRACGPEHLFVSGRSAPHWPSNKLPIFNLPDQEFIGALKKLKGTHQEVIDNPEVMRFFIKVIRADFEMTDTYEYCHGEPLRCPVTVYGGIDDEHVPIESCHAWGEHTSAECEVTMCEGDHFFVRNARPDFMAAFKSAVLRTAPALRSQSI